MYDRQIIEASRDQSLRVMVRSILTLAWPLTAANLLDVLTEVIAVFWASRMCGDPGLLVVTAVRPVIFCLIFVFSAVVTGAVVSVARSIGAGTREGMRFYAAATALVIALWLVTLAILLPLIGPLAEVLGHGDLPLLDDYLVPWLVFALPTVMLMYLGVDVAAAAQQTRVAFVRSIADLVLLSLLTPILITAFGLGGVAAAQAVSAGILALLLLRQIWRSREAWQLGELAGATTGLVRRWLEILNIGLPVQLARAATFAAQAVMIGFVAADGPASVAAYGTSVMLLVIGANCSLAIAQAGGILIAQAAGAGDSVRVRGALRASLVTAALCGVTTAAIFMVGGGMLLRLFTDDALVLARGMYAIRIMSVGLLAIAMWQALLVAMAAMKASKRGGLIGVASELLGLAWIVVWPSELRLESVVIAFLVSNASRAIMLAVLCPFVVKRQHA